MNSLSRMEERKTRVLFLNNQGLAAMGGGVTILRHLVDGLVGNYDVTLLSLDPPSDGYNEVRQLRMPMSPKATGRWWRFAPLLRARHLIGAIPKEEILAADVVVALDCHFALAMLHHRPKHLIYLSLSCIPRMEWFGSSEAQRWLNFPQYAWLERSIVGAACSVVVASHMHAAEMRRFELLTRFNPVVLPPAFPVARLPNRGPVASDQVTILSAGRLVPVKQFGAVVEMADRLRDLPCRFVIAGDGPERQPLQARVDALGLGERVQLVGTQEGLEPMLAIADIFLHPTRYESFGIAVLEAMQSGIPVVLNDRSLAGCREMLLTEALELADFSRPGEAARLLRRLIVDPVLRARVGKAGQRSAAALLQIDYVAAFRSLIDRVAMPPLVSV
jgi:glycosyltransferase involved in cell wall biosynthesis